MSRGEQISRQWRLLRRLENAGESGLSVTELSKDEDCHERTIYRDLEALQYAGFPLVDQKEGTEAARWAMLQGRNRPLEIPFSYSELLALHISYDAMKCYSGTPFFEAIEEMYRKIQSALSPSSLSFLGQVKEHFMAPGRPPIEHATHYETTKLVNEAILKGRTLSFTYFTLYRNATEPRRVDPYSLRAHEGSIFLIGFCHDRKELRTFAVQRMNDVVVSDNQFKVAERFSFQEYLRDSFNTFHGEVQKVVIRFSKNVAALIRERSYHASQRVADNSDGSITLTMETGGLEEVKRWVLAFGDNAEVLEPESFRISVQSVIQNMMRIYRPK